MKKEQTKTSDLILNSNPKSRFAEAIKLIRTNLAFSNVDKKVKTILITSPEEGDGKSFISSNLAVAYAQEGKKVLIIDCDLRRGRVHRIFKIANKSATGYSNLILNYKTTNVTEKESDTFNINTYICPTEIDGLRIIPRGPIAPNPVELLSSTTNEKVINKLRKMYDIIILDCPPVVGLSDTIIEAKHADVNVLVVSRGKTKEESLAKAVKIYEQANMKINGVVFNNDKVKSSKYYSYYAGEK